MISDEDLIKILRRLLEYKDYFSDETAIYRIEHPMYTDLSPKLENFHDLIYKLNIPDIAYDDGKLFYGDVIKKSYEKYGVSDIDELCKQKLNYIEIFSILTALVRSCRMDPGFLANFVESRNAYQILLRCEKILKYKENKKKKGRKRKRKH